MHWTAWVVAFLVLVNAGWMTFDGARALIVGDYVTPKSGRHAGQLGPWSILVATVGIPPRSTLMKCIFVGYGAAYLLVLIAFMLGRPWGWWGMVVVAVLGLWHLPFGTLINVLVLLLISSPALRGMS